MIQTVPTFRRLGSYVLLPLTGAGGMGRVDVALPPAPVGGHQLCVIKRMHAALRTPESVARFRREAEIASRLNHPAIAKTLDVEQVDGELCILQEFVHGANVAQLEGRAATHEPLPVPLSVFIAKEVCSALAHAHANNAVVHRDVTPDNIMLSYTGEVKLVDFGIAKPVDDKSLTRVGLVVGRPIYTPPEVLAGAQADTRSDLYSLGVVLWQMLTGRSFPDRGSPIAPSIANPLVHPGLDGVTLRATAVRTCDRFQTAHQLLAALNQLPSLGEADAPTLAAFLGRHFDVAAERRQLDLDIGTARAVIAEQRRPVCPGRHLLGAAGGIGPALSRRVPVLGLALIGLVALSLLAWTFIWRPGRTASTTSQPRVLIASEQGVAAEPVGGVFLEAARAYRFGSLDRALLLAKRAVQAGAGGQAHLIEGKVLLARQNLAEATAAFREAARLLPEDPEPRRYLQLLQREGKGWPTESVLGRRHE